MTDKRRLEIEAEAAEHITNMCALGGGVLEVGKNAKLTGDVGNRYEAACKDAQKFQDKNGRVSPAVQAIYARMYGLI